MDSLINAAARALAVGDPLGALNRVALREDPPALALRGIAMAQLGDLVRARALVRRAARAFGAREALARARCVVAEADIALAARDFGYPSKTLAAAAATLAARGDTVNAAHAHYLDVRRALLIGHVDAAEQKLAALDAGPFPPALRAVHELMAAGIALRRLHMKAARAALLRAEQAARDARIPALMAEVDAVRSTLSAPAARVLAHGHEQPLQLEQVAALFESNTLVVDACRYIVRANDAVVSLATRPVLFTLARALGEAWPDDVARDALVARAFRGKRADESHRARLRVEMGRLRAQLRPLADIRATPRGYALAARESRHVAVLLRPLEERYGAVLACLADGEAWSSSALALALGTSQRNVQRALDALAWGGKVQSFGRGRARRWLTPLLPGFATTLLLLMPLPTD